MSRNASGTYTLPTGNPVVSGTDITVTWGNNTMNDIATEMTDSLSRSGKGGMLAPLTFFDGSVSVPGISWVSDANTGFYRIGADNMAMTAGGVQIVDYANNAFTFSGTANTSTTGPIFSIFRNSASPADADLIGDLRFDGEDSAGNKTTYASVSSQIDDVTNATEDGTLLVKTMTAGTLTTQLDISSALVDITPATTIAGLTTIASLKGTGAVTITDILDEDNMASDSATKLATQQSIKAYVDASSGDPEGTAVLSTGETGTSKFLRIDGDGTSSWQVPPTGDITAVIAGTGISGGGTSGDVTITNSAPNIVQTTVTGNAGTATTLQTARTIAGVSFDGSANISLNNNAITNGAGYTTSVGDITGVTAGTGISGGGTSGTVTITNSAPNIVQTTVSGNAGTATTLQTARTIAGVSFDGSANISLNNNAITNGAGYTTNTGDITGVTAGTGISGGGTSGTVTITNSSPNATHTGEVTGATALTIADNVVDEANLKVSNAPTNGYMLTAQSGNTGGLTWAAAASGGGGMVWSVKTTTYTAATDEAIIANTSGGIWTLTLPATPVVGDVVRVADGASWETNNLTVARNGSTIEGVAQDVTMDINSASVDFVYDGTTWQVYVSMGTELVDYLPLAGGTLTGDLQVKGVQETVIALSGTTPAIDPTAGTIATWTLSGASTPTFGAGWAEGESILLMIDDGAGNTITWPTMQWAGGTAPTLPTTGYAVVTLFKVGATFYGTSAGDMS